MSERVIPNPLDALAAWRESQGAGAEAPAPPSRGAPQPTATSTTDSDRELGQMQAEAPLFDLICSDTGERPTIGDTTYFRDVCPVCGARDCFRYYPSTNTWACFGGSNEHTKPGQFADGGGYIKYLLRTGRAQDNTEAVKLLREATGNPYKGTKAKTDTSSGETGTDTGNAEGKPKRYQLPEPRPIESQNPPKRAPHLLRDTLRRGHTALCVARSKSYKSWDAIALCICVACGMPWHGIETGEGARCIYIDPEIDYRTLCWRFSVVAEAIGADKPKIDARVLRWSLRGAITPKGEPPTIADVCNDARMRVSAGEWERGQFALVVIDSCSCLLSGDENSSHDVRAFHNRCLELAGDLDASVWCVQHEGLTLTENRDAINRARGSSVWADAFDLVLSLARLYPPSGEPSDFLADGQAAFILESGGNREFNNGEPIHLLWNFPAFSLDAENVTEGWTVARNKGQHDGGDKTGKLKVAEAAERRATALLALYANLYSGDYGEEGIKGTEACSIVAEALGKNSVKADTVKGYVEDTSGAFDCGLSIYQKSPRKWFVVPSHTPHVRTQSEGGTPSDGQANIQ